MNNHCELLFVSGLYTLVILLLCFGAELCAIGDSGFIWTALLVAAMLVLSTHNGQDFSARKDRKEESRGTAERDGLVPIKVPRKNNLEELQNEDEKNAEVKHAGLEEARDPERRETERKIIILESHLAKRKTDSDRTLRKLDNFSTCLNILEALKGKRSLEEELARIGAAFQEQDEEVSRLKKVISSFSTFPSLFSLLSSYPSPSLSSSFPSFPSPSPSVPPNLPISPSLSSLLSSYPSPSLSSPSPSFPSPSPFVPPNPPTYPSLPIPWSATNEMKRQMKKLKQDYRTFERLVFEMERNETEDLEVRPIRLQVRKVRDKLERLTRGCCCGSSEGDGRRDPKDPHRPVPTAPTSSSSYSSYGPPPFRTVDEARREIEELESEQRSLEGLFSEMDEEDVFAIKFAALRYKLSLLLKKLKIKKEATPGPLTPKQELVTDEKYREFYCIPVDKNFQLPKGPGIPGPRMELGNGFRLRIPRPLLIYPGPGMEPRPQIPGPPMQPIQMPVPVMGHDIGTGPIMQPGPPRPEMEPIRKQDARGIPGPGFLPEPGVLIRPGIATGPTMQPGQQEYPMGSSQMGYPRPGMGFGPQGSPRPSMEQTKQMPVPNAEHRRPKLASEV